jgi:hypothetical protein
MNNKTWDIQVINKTNDGYLVMVPNGDTQWLTIEEFEKLQKK